MLVVPNKVLSAGKYAVIYKQLSVMKVFPFGASFETFYEWNNKLNRFVMSGCVKNYKQTDFINFELHI